MSCESRLCEELLRLADVSFRGWTDERYIVRGRGYLSRVLSPVFGADGTVAARVRGTEIYTTRLFLDRAGHLEASCSCPVGGRCKHAVALAMVVAERFQGAGDSRSGTFKNNLASRVLFCFVALPGVKNISMLREFTKVREGSAQNCNLFVLEACEDLRRQGWLKLVSKDLYGNAHRKYVLAKTFSVAELQALARLAEKHQWWPDLRLVRTACGLTCVRPLLSEEKNWYVGHEQRLRDVVNGLRALILGEGEVPNDPTVESILFCHWLCLVSNGERLLPLNESRTVPVPLGVRLLDFAFTLGRTIGSDLETLVASCVRNPVQTSRVVVAELVGLCLWCGRVDLADQLFDIDWNDPKLFALLAACQTLSVDVGFIALRRAVMDLWTDDVQELGRSVSFRLLGVALAVRAGAEGRELAAFSRRQKGAPRPYSWRPDEHPAAMQFRLSTEHVFEGYSELGDSDWGLVLESLRYFAPEGQSMASELSRYLVYALAKRHGINLRQRDTTELVKRFPQGEKVLARGYSTVAGVVASASAGLMDAYQVRKLADAVDAARGLWLLPYEKPEADWLGTLKKLARVVPESRPGRQSEPAEDKAKGTLVWGLEFGPSYLADAASGFVALKALNVACRSDAGEIRDLTFPAAASPEYAACRTERDNTVLCEAVWSRMDRSQVSAAPGLLRLLVDAPNLMRVKKRRIYRYGDPVNRYEPITLNRSEIALTVERKDDGSLVFSVPNWSVGLDVDECVREESECVYAYYELSPRVQKLLRIFAERGTGGVIKFPAEAEGEVRELLAGLADVVPVTGAAGLEMLEEERVLRRVDGDVTLVVRLSFARDVLKATYGFKPYLGAAFVEPISETREEAVRIDGRPVLLVRDAEKEEIASDVLYGILDGLAYEPEGVSTLSFAALDQALEFLVRLRGLGDAVRVEWLEGRRLKVGELTQANFTDGKTERDWFAVQGEFKIDEEHVLDIVAMLQALDRGVGTFVRLTNGDFVRISEALKKRLEAVKAAGQVRKKAVEVSRAAVPMLTKAFDGEAGLPKELQVAATRFADEFKRKIDVPRALQATLRPYQKEGFAWLARHTACGFGACLADDMGLGKTVQTIALLLTHADEGSSLVVAPTSVCGNWRGEIARFAPTLKVRMGWEFDPNEVKPFAGLGKNEVVVTSYGMLVSRARMFASRAWNGIVLDEAQAIKNDLSKRARIVKTLKARFRVAATGTPVENRLSELWSLFDFLNPGLLGPSASFAERLTTSEGLATDELKRLVEPFVLRRLKQNVLTDLPAKTEVTLTVELGPKERTAYEACRIKALESLKGSEDDRISILAELTRLRRFCSHPSLVLPDFTESAKLDALHDLLSDLKGAGHRALVFSQFTDYLSIVRRLLEEKGWTYQYLDGSTPIAARAKAVDAFQKGEGDFFLISLKAGGTGLNLTAANYVVLLDPWWNPAVENQAADRVHRIGQKNPVTVYRLIAAKTVEERVLELHQEKKRIAEDVLEGTGRTALSPELLMRLFAS